MSPAFRRFLSAIVVAGLAPVAAVAMAGSAAAFQVGESPDFKGCYVWFNDAGQPLHNKSGREIGRKAPCGEGTHNRDSYEVLFGEAKDTLVIRDATHHFECILELAAGSATVVVPKVCQPWDE
ncbi:hypothetical protein [Lichenibacterium ramalinae]|uniref:Secreted protein n=1 Tax=Lichenibacterium ramalinae TaxID=2316527 RepID=A0A4Q2RHE7_9HYPH|nr:hypothetical protein [Lichenibacterium ramalinae]RYB07675.1 hypothetical protein D3272_00640 [Lichenibacterium ramalinae]